MDFPLKTAPRDDRIIPSFLCEGIVMDAKRIGTGIEGLDRAIDCLRSGDTVLW